MNGSSFPPKKDAGFEHKKVKLIRLKVVVCPWNEEELELSNWNNDFWITKWFQVSGTCHTPGLLK